MERAKRGYLARKFNVGVNEIIALKQEPLTKVLRQRIREAISQTLTSPRPSLPKPPVRVSGKYRLIKCDGHNLYSSLNDQVVKATDSIITGSVLYDD